MAEPGTVQENGLEQEVDINRDEKPNSYRKKVRDVRVTRLHAWP